MSTTLQFDPAPDWNIDGKITLTYEGASPDDSGPAGAILRMMIAQLSQDKEALKNAVTENTLSTMGQPNAPGKDLSVKFKSPQFEGDDQNTAVLPAELLVDGQPQELPFITVKEDSGWKVDMPATLQRLMGGSMEQLTAAFEEGMKQMAEGMKGVMEGMGEAMSEAFGGSGDSTQSLDSEPSHPVLAEFRRNMIDQLGMHWIVRADEDAFATSNPELLQDALDTLFKGIVEVSQTDEGTGRLNAMDTLEIRKEHGPKRIDREGITLIYDIGETEDGRADLYHGADVVAPLAQALEGIL
jgi:hypothetical protein